MDLASRVRDRRIELGLSQEELSLRIGAKSRSTVNKIENGRPITQKVIVKLAEALSVSPTYLMGWDDEEQAAQFDVEKDAELLTLFHQLSADQQDSVLNLIKSMNK